MATPLISSMFKPTDFDLFLDEIGLEDLDPRGRIELVDKVMQSIEYAFVTKIFRRLSQDKQIQLIELMKESEKTGSDAEVNAFLLAEVPDVEALVDETIEKVKNDLRLSTASMTDSIGKQMAMLGYGQDQKDGTNQSDLNEESTEFTPIKPPLPPIPPLPLTQTEINPDSRANAQEDAPFPWEIADDSSAAIQTRNLENRELPSSTIQNTEPDDVVQPYQAEPVASDTFPWEEPVSAGNAVPDSASSSNKADTDLASIRQQLEQADSTPANVSEPENGPSDSQSAINEELSSIDN